MSALPLYLLHMRPDARLLATWIARHQARHARQPEDLGDALHGLLRAAFGTRAPQPFRYFDDRRGLLAYTPLTPEQLRTRLAHAEPLVAQTLGLTANAHTPGWRARPLPSQWPNGHVLAFEVRVRPTMRAARGEQDAYLHAARQAPETALQRQAVYVNWLRQRLAAKEGQPPARWQSAVELLDDVHLVAYRRLRIRRRTQATAAQARHGHVIDGPDAVLAGHLRISDPAAFMHLLARGVGRHRAFGYGMLLLKPATC